MTTLAAMFSADVVLRASQLFIKFYLSGAFLVQGCESVSELSATTDMLGSAVTLYG